MFPTTASVCIVAILLCSTGFASSKTCWPTAWINNNHPTSSARNDVEPRPSTADLNAVCPQGLTTLTAQCKDNKGEPFHGTQNSTCGQAATYFIVTCDAQNGLNCTPYGAGCMCPDFSIQYGCDCQTTPKAGITPAGAATTAPAGAAATKPAGGATPTPGQNGNDASVTSANFAMHVVLFLAAFMF